MQNYKYLISVVMPVYNSALYIDEAMESLISQSIGFDSIQLIAVNDGSTDSSGEILRKYKKRYSDNIVLIEKENGGVSSARNEALKHIEGKYVAFLDPDDTLPSNTYEEAFKYFEQIYEKVNVVAFPIRFFGATKGEHPLNTKFAKGERVINLLDEPCFQLHITATLIKSEIAKKISFKNELIVSEDANALMRVLIDFPRLGVISSTHYNYRKREDSLIGTSATKKGWYFDHITHYFEDILDYAEEKYDKIPSFVQNAVIYDISWKLNQKTRPICLTEDEVNEFIARLLRCVSRLDRDNVMSCHTLSEMSKRYLLGIKDELSRHPYSLEFIDTSSDKIKISCRLPVLTKATDSVTPIAYVNGAKIASCRVENEPRTSFLGKEIVTNILFDIEFDKSSERQEISFGMELDGEEAFSSNVTFGRFFPLERKYVSSNITENAVTISYKGNSLIIEKLSKKESKKRHRALLKEIWKSNGFAERKAIIARALAAVYKKLHKKPIWIISDRLSTADDNGEVLFAYLNKSNFKDASYFYAIRKGKDYSRLKRQGRALNRASLKYKILFLASDIIISSQAEDFVINPFDYYWQPYKDILSRKKFVFLQHGVIKDDLSAWLSKYNKNIAGFVCSSRAELNSILTQKRYHYTEKELWLTGLPRFDRLESTPQKIVTVMPTWRRYLVEGIDIETGKWRPKGNLRNSEYVHFWSSLLTNERLLTALKKYDYKLNFVPHPNMRCEGLFIDTSDRVSIINDANYSKIYSDSDMVITDYSSAVFDLAYLDKPIIYAQFDKEKFFSGAHTYQRGYFDYERDGFGKVTFTLDETVDAVIQCIENGCKNPEEYQKRVNEFFVYRDKNNCRRALEKILELGDKNDNSK